jgi:hypothetical protein
MNKTARAMLEAQVQYELQSLRGEAFDRLVRQEVAALFAWCGQVSLNEAATREQIVDVIQRRAIDLRISGGITELAGEMANRVFTSAHNEDTRLEDIVPSRSFEEIVDKVVGLEQARGELIHRATHSGAYRTLVASLLRRSLMDFLFPPQDRSPRSPQAWLADVGRSVARRVVPDLERHITTRLSQYLDANVERIACEGEKQLVLALDQVTLRRAAEEIWEELAPMRLSEAFAQIQGYDLEDFVVIGYEFWLKYRKTDYFSAIVRDLVGHFFDKYGEDSLLSLIDDMGVTQDMVVVDVRELAGPVVALARSTGWLEQRVRAHLEPFYRSERVEEILSTRPGAPRKRSGKRKTQS